jgi:type IV pilus assembly protein PilB
MPTFKFGGLGTFLRRKDGRAQMVSPKADAQAQADAGKQESIVDIIHELEKDEKLGARVARKETRFDPDVLMEIQDASPVRKLVSMVMLLAIRDRASDIHFEPFENEYKLRYRCDGVLMELVPPPRHLATQIADRIKVMANLDITERRRPQHGRIELNVGGNSVFMRVSVVPTLFGESVFIRVFDPTAVALDLTKVGMDPQTLHQFRQMIHKPGGMILVTGPTGAGKTATLYSALNELNEITEKIITTEDPVEYEIDGIVQCPMRHDLTFADTLRAIFGQDPDVVVVGAIRDQGEAQITMQAVLGGRKVLSTLNANDAPSSISQLCSMGLEPSLIAAAVKGILAQRLVRKICENCRTEFEPSRDVLMELNLQPYDIGGKTFCYGRGCDRCNHTGHRGRMGIFELLVVDDFLRDMVSVGASTDQLRQACHRRGMITLRESGLRSLFEGKTTIEEVSRETMRENEG